MTQSNPPIDTDASPWLVDLLLTPPLWARALLFVAAGVCLVLAARRVYDRDLYIPLAEQREMLLIVGTVEAIAVGVIGAMEVGGLGYAPAVLTGVVSGFAAVEILRRADLLFPPTLADERAQVTAAWAGVAVVAFALPFVVPNPAGVDVAIGTVGVGMLMWTTLQEYGPGETVGDVARAE